MNTESRMSVEEIANIAIENAIITKYPLRKQNQDLVWTNYYKTELIANGETDVEQKVVDIVLAVKDGKSVDDALNNIDDDKKDAYKKLVKVAIRTSWARDCINEGLVAIAERRNPNYSQFPRF